MDVSFQFDKLPKLSIRTNKGQLRLGPRPVDARNQEVSVVEYSQLLGVKRHFQWNRTRYLPSGSKCATNILLFAAGWVITSPFGLRNFIELPSGMLPFVKM